MYECFCFGTGWPGTRGGRERGLARDRWQKKKRRQLMTVGVQN